MIERMGAEVAPSTGYAAACRRAAASGRRRRVPVPRERPPLRPPVELSGGPLGAIQAADREIARQTALRARAVAEFAATRPASADHAQGEPGAMSPERWAARPELLRRVSEWAAQELVVALSITETAAEALLTRSLTLVHRLPGTLAALEAGALHPGHLWPMLDKVAPIDDDAVRAEVEATLLHWAAGRVTTPAQLGAKARREVLARDARSAARRLADAIKDRGVHLRAEPTDGMATVTAVLTMPEAQALYRALGAYADALPDADGDDGGDGLPARASDDAGAGGACGPETVRTRGQKMADCLMDLVLRPGETDMPPVQVLLTLVASVGTMLGGDDPGEIDGHVVPAQMVRSLVHALIGTAKSEPSAAHAPADLPRQQVDQEELERWWAEIENRPLAGEFGGVPEPGSGADVAVTVVEGRPLLDPQLPGTIGNPVDPRELADPRDLAEPRELADPPDLVDPPGAVPWGGLPDAIGESLPDPPWPEDPVPRDPIERAGPAEDAWWAAADESVGDAGEALRRAEVALGRARRRVQDARRADAADEAAWQAGPGGRIAKARDAIAALEAAAAEQREQVAELLAATGGGGLAERPRIALTDNLSGALLALTDLPGLRRAAHCGAAACRRRPERCTHDLTGRSGLGPPGPTDGYRPAAELDRWVRARDRRCRFPGCRRRVPRGGELDHDRPYPDGPTSAENLTGFCTRHHRGKHQAPGWRHALLPDGTLTVSTPTGLTAVTTPPPY
jgi:hypothetical protein